MIGTKPSRRDGFAMDRRPVRRARVGLRYLLAELLTRPDDVVLLPAYIGQSPLDGSGVMDPIRDLQCGYVFYRVLPDLSADLDDFRSKLADPRVAAALLIHYFGAPQPDTRAMAAASEARGVALIEDCCHCFASRLEGRLVGGFGAYALYSIHKVLATRSGGILQVNPGAPVSPAVSAADTGDPEDLSLWTNADFEAVARRRIENYRALAHAIAGIRDVRPFWQVLPDGTVPLNFPVLVAGHDRFELYRRLRALGVGAVALYHTLIAEIDPARYPESYELSTAILNLPIHQDVEVDEIPLIAELLDQALGEA